MALYKHIIVPLDGSETSAQALPVARLMAQTTGAPMSLVRSVNAIPDWQADAGLERYTASLAIAERDRMAGYLEGARLGLLKQGVTSPIHIEPREGPAVEAITSVAARHPGSLIVMSTHGRSGFSRMVMGSVTSRVVGSVKNPVLVVCNKEDGSPMVLDAVEHVIVPLDGSKFAEAALPHAAEMARTFDARVTLYQSTPGVEYFQSHTDWGRLNGEAGFNFGGPTEMASRLGELAREYLHRMAVEMETRFGISGVAFVHSSRNASDAIVKLASESANSLVVMTTHGRSGVGRALLGSVADRVVRQSPAPTLLVRGSMVATEAADHDHTEQLAGTGA